MICAAFRSKSREGKLKISPLRRPLLSAQSGLAVCERVILSRACWQIRSTGWPLVAACGALMNRESSLAMPEDNLKHLHDPLARRAGHQFHGHYVGRSRHLTLCKFGNPKLIFSIADEVGSASRRTRAHIQRRRTLWSPRHNQCC